MLGRKHAQGREHAIGHPALTDSQTGLANRLHFELVYSYLFAAGNRGLSFTVMLLSVGGPDAVPESRLRSLGEQIQSTTRDSDLVAHVGRGRYVVLLLGTNLQGARIAADRVEVALAGDEGALSMGLAVYSPNMQDSSDLLEAADKALLTAEAAGGGVEFG
ncbi:MAG: GGDEF domain-containing protein [Gemmatimonadota bacterium]|nr:GGDEF domain-containing protein [Gemmatimonadota bacterium]MDH3421761.1 GGDEF domain-containing protein [Gemmatimonadota bacterium]